ncbi:inactive tyrosine-protein kinase transmembrane receptor ROR1-like, partial [Sinocyclocheilus grahami]|uniref:inactive tyrosine-protein kinase transmembrane receptor ROR1-like n=1 Tax=Sinocyclocheilus grahami TaxID=75366 RepID=UPI0007AC926D
NQEVMEMVRKRQLLPCPEDCPPRMYMLMAECWQEGPTRRPRFKDIHTRLRAWECLSSHASSSTPSGGNATTQTTSLSASPVSNLSSPRYAGYIYGPPQSLVPGQIAGFMAAPMPQNQRFIPVNGYPIPTGYAAFPAAHFAPTQGPPQMVQHGPPPKSRSPSSASGSTSTGHMTSIPSTGSNHDANTPLLSHCVTLTPMTAVSGGTMPVFGHMAQKTMQIDPSQAVLLADTNRRMYSDSIITADL